MVVNAVLVGLLIAEIGLVLWVNHQSKIINALNTRITALEQRATAKAKDPVASFKTL